MVKPAEIKSKGRVYREIKMINPINKTADLNRAVQTEQNSSAKEKTKTTNNSVDQSNEEIHLSEAFREIEKLRDIIDNTSEINHTRVEYLKSLVDNGEYKVNSQDVANRITSLDK